MSGNITRSSGNSVPVLTSAPALRGRVVEARGVVARVVGVSLRIGEKVRLVRPDTFETQYGEVVGFAHDGALIMPLAGLAGLSDITEVQGCGSTWGTFDAAGLLGRVVDGLGNPLDGGGRAPAARDWRGGARQCRGDAQSARTTRHRHTVCHRRARD